MFKFSFFFFFSLSLLFILLCLNGYTLIINILFKKKKRIIDSWLYSMPRSQCVGISFPFRALWTTWLSALGFSEQHDQLPVVALALMNQFMTHLFTAQNPYGQHIYKYIHQSVVRRWIWGEGRVWSERRWGWKIWRQDGV